MASTRSKKSYFTDIVDKGLQPLQDMKGLEYIDNILAMQVGSGSKCFKTDQSGIWLGANRFASAPFRVDMSGNLTATSATISGMAQNFVSTLSWTATDADTATWSAGTIKTTDGTTYNIVTGNTGNIASTTYVYLDSDTSTTVLQKTTTATNAIGSNKFLIAIVQKGATGAKCIIDVISSNGTTIDGDRITTGKIQSTDSKTYFDLDNDKIIMNDRSNDRLLIGDDS